MTRQLFVDLDGVLADFDGHYERTFGVTPDRNQPEPPDFWTQVEEHGSFFDTMPPMGNAYVLWFGCLKLHPNPIILTGAPTSVPSAAAQKRAWVRRHLGLVNVICCKSRDKCLYAKPGDVLIDDWSKYRGLWESAGGVFIHHQVSATSTLYEARIVFDEIAFRLAVPR